MTYRDEIGNAQIFEMYNAKDVTDRLARYEDMRIPTVDASVLTQALTIYGGDSQVDMMIEEMSELTKALLKQRRTQRAGCKYDRERVMAIIEEMADVYIVLLQMIQLFGEPTLFEEYVDEKMLRLRLRMFEDVKEDAE